MTQSEKKRTLFSGARNSKKKWIIVGLAVAVIAGGGVFGYRTLLTPERAQAAYQVVTVKRGDVSETVLASGTVQASKRSSLSFSDAEDAKDAISTIQVKIGDHVKAGQVLATMDDSVAKIQVTNAQANLLSAQAKLEDAQKRKSAAEISSLQAAVTQAKNELELAKQNIDGQKATNDVAKAKANLDNAQKTFDSQKKLFEAGAISQTEYDNAQDALEQAKRDYNSAVLTAGQTSSQSGVKVEQALASYQTAQEALKEAQEGPDSATILAAKAAVEQAKAELQKAQKALNAVTLRAPMDGVIVQLNGNVGEIPGNDFIIMDNSNSGELEVLAQISQRDIGKVKEGLPVSFTTSSYPDETFTGKVKLIYPEAKTDSGVTSYDVLLSVTNKDSKLKNRDDDERHDRVGNAQGCAVRTGLCFADAKRQGRRLPDVRKRKQRRSRERCDRTICSREVRGQAGGGSRAASGADGRAHKRKRRQNGFHAVPVRADQDRIFCGGSRRSAGRFEGRGQSRRSDQHKHKLVDVQSERCPNGRRNARPWRLPRWRRRRPDEGTMRR